MTDLQHKLETSVATSQLTSITQREGALWMQRLQTLAIKGDIHLTAQTVTEIRECVQSRGVRRGAICWDAELFMLRCSDP